MHKIWNSHTFQNKIHIFHDIIHILQPPTPSTDHLFINSKAPFLQWPGHHKGKWDKTMKQYFLKILVPFDCHQNRVKNIHFSVCSADIIFLIRFLSCKKTQTSDIPMSLLIPWTVIHFKYLKYSLELGTLYNLKTSANKSERRVTQVLAAQFRPSSTIASYRNLI